MLKKLLPVLVCCATGCSSEHLDTTPLLTQKEYDAIRIRDFWGWFKREKPLFETMTDSSRDQRLNIVLDHLAPISDNLAIEVSKENKGVRELIISADGDKNKFPIVEEIVKGAPKIPGWTVTAFRQKASEDFVLKFGNLQLSPAEMFFRPLIEKDSLDLVIYADSIDNRSRADVIKYGLITMDNVIGEYAATLKVRSFNFKDSRELRTKAQVCKLDRLPRFVDSVYASKHPLAKTKV